MSLEVNSSRLVSRSSLFRGEEQRVVMLIGSLCSLIMVWYGLHHCGLPNHCVHFDRADSVPSGFRVSLNSATWPELTQMPGIAETLARRIVAHRRVHGPFASPDELRQIHGIGPKLLQGMRPYLVPMNASGTAPQ